MLGQRRQQQLVNAFVGMVNYQPAARSQRARAVISLAAGQLLSFFTQVVQVVLDVGAMVPDGGVLPSCRTEETLCSDLSQSDLSRAASSDSSMISVTPRGLYTTGLT